MVWFAKPSKGYPRKWAEFCDQAAGGGQKEATRGHGFLPKAGVPWGEGWPLCSRDLGTLQQALRC